MELLVIEDDALFARALARAVDPVRTTWAPGLAAARRLLARRWDGCVLDVLLPDGMGLDLVSELRERDPFLPILVLTGDSDPRTIERCARERLWWSPKPECLPVLAELVELCGMHRQRAGSGVQRSVLATLRAFAAAHGLTRRETEIVEHAMRGSSREQIAAELGMQLKTYDNHASSILAKVGAGRIVDVANEAWRWHVEGLSARPSGSRG